MNLLFICSRNKWRSPTAERLFRKHPGVQCRSAGTSTAAARRVKASDIHWSDVICVMEHEHSQRLRRDFRNDLGGKTMHILDIPDEYQFMDPELMDLIIDAVTPILKADLTEEQRQNPKSC